MHNRIQFKQKKRQFKYTAGLIEPTGMDAEAEQKNLNSRLEVKLPLKRRWKITGKKQF